MGEGEGVKVGGRLAPPFPYSFPFPFPLTLYPCPFAGLILLYVVPMYPGVLLVAVTRFKKDVFLGFGSD